MIKIEKIEVWGFEHAIRGLRNPMNSWDKSDSKYCNCGDKLTCQNCKMYSKSICYSGDGIEYIIGKNDLDLMRKLYNAGSEHRKYLRQIFVSFDITAPLYWWKEFDTYKIGTVANSCSTMHKIHSKEFELDDFSHEHLFTEEAYKQLNKLIEELNENRDSYIKTNRKEYWWQMIQLLPSSYNQKRTITMNYENVITMIKQRSGHKLDEWNILVEELKKIPYISEIIS